MLKRELVFKEDGQEYAQVLKMLGNGRLQAYCFDGRNRLCHIRGKLRKKVWINTGDIILIGLRDYQDDKSDVILKYNTEEARNLKAYGELPDNAKLNEGGDGEDGDFGVEFADGPDAGSGSDTDPIGEQPTASHMMMPDSESESETESDTDTEDEVDAAKSKAQVKGVAPPPKKVAVKGV